MCSPVVFESHNLPPSICLARREPRRVLCAAALGDVHAALGAARRRACTRKVTEVVPRNTAPFGAALQQKRCAAASPSPFLSSCALCERECAGFSLSFVFETEGPACCDGGTSTPGSRDPAALCVFAQGAAFFGGGKSRRGFFGRRRAFGTQKTSPACDSHGRSCVLRRRVGWARAGGLSAFF